MTPIKYLGYHMNLVFVVDMADMMTHVAVTFGEEQSRWLCESLAGFHRVGYRRFDGIPATFIRDPE
jgi:hypothetical protein